MNKSHPIVTERTRSQRFIIGALLAAAFFMVEAGVGEIALARNAGCLETLQNLLIQPPAEELCMSDLTNAGTIAASRGVVGVVSPEAPAVIGWLVMIVVYGSVGGLCAQMSFRWGLVTFLGINAITVIVLTFVGYFSRFVVG